MPDGCLEAIGKAYSDKRIGKFKNLVQIYNDPLKFLFSVFSESHQDRSFLHIKELVNLAEFKNTVISLGIINDEQWTVWKPFIEDFSEINRSLDELDRSSFIGIVQSRAPINTPAGDILLKYINWDGTIELFDMTIYAQSLIKERAWSFIKKELAISLCSEISQWDVELCEVLAEEALESLLSPFNILREVALARGWDKYVDFSSDELLQVGILRSFNGLLQHHSAFLALRGKEKEVNKRLWKAQMKVLFPYIEIQRQIFLETFGHKMILPHITPHGEKIEILYDLELGHINNQLTTNFWIADHRTKSIISQLRDIRNSLAHGRAIPAHKFNPEIFYPDIFEK